MPGLAGFTYNSANNEHSRFVLQKMQDLMHHRDCYARDKLFCNGSVYATRSHINIIQKRPQPYKNAGIYIWLDGEFYNQKELLQDKDVAAMDDAEILYHLHVRNKDFSFLGQIDGIFAAVIYDSVNQKIHLITDRYGIRHLYWTIHKGEIAWGSEIKIFLALADLVPMINNQAIEQFINIGYLLEDHTWFEGIELVPSGTILTWDISKRTFSKQRYWWWDRINMLSEKDINREDEIVDELARLFNEAVKKRFNANERMFISLSGGLDSRAILAAAPQEDRPIQALTFGINNCADIMIAKQAAKTKGAIHHIYEIHSNNWLISRLKGVWWTDGQLNLMHMHGLVTGNDIESDLQVNLSGFAGDVVLGGSFLKNKEFIDVPINNKLAAMFMNCHTNHISRLDNYLDLPRTDYYFLQNRIRRFVGSGAKMMQIFTEQRKPFYDNKLMEFIYSLPDKLRFQSYLYKKMLLKAFPRYFQDIPWQKTGRPISAPEINGKIIDCFDRIKRRVSHHSQRVGLRFNNSKEFANYALWLRKEPAKSLLNSILMNPSALYQKYIPKGTVTKLLERHFNGQNHSELICRYLTLEVWLRQVFNNDLKDEISCAK